MSQEEEIYQRLAGCLALTRSQAPSRLNRERFLLLRCQAGPGEARENQSKGHGLGTQRETPWRSQPLMVRWGSGYTRREPGDKSETAP